MMAIRGPVGIRKPGAPVRRCLFGPPDHEQVRKDLDRSLKHLEKSTKELLRSKWGYDSDSECGISDGRYEFTKVQDWEYLPEFYRKGYKTRTRRTTDRVDRVDMVSIATQVEATTSTGQPTVSSGTQAAQGLESQIHTRTVATGVRKLDFKENCVNSVHSSRPSRNNSVHQTKMPDHYQMRKRRSPDSDLTVYHRGKSPRL